MPRQNPSARDPDTFGVRLAAARKLRRLSQTELAGLLGVSLPRYHAWEHNNATPNNIALYGKLCSQLDVTVNWLFFGEDSVLSPETRNGLEILLSEMAAAPEESQRHLTA